MNKQEMAEWLAEEVLGCTYCKDCEVWVSDVVKGDIVKFIYSPDGMDAVWDTVEEKLEGGEDEYGCFAEALHGINFSPKEDGRDCCAITTSRKTSYGRGKTRREAFYNAVYEAMKE